MSEEKTSPILTALQATFPIIAMIIMALSSQFTPWQTLPEQYFVSAFVAEILLLIVFTKGEICNGQRSRLVKANQAIWLFWIIPLIISVITGAYWLTGLALLGIFTALLIKLQRGLTFAFMLSIFGVFVTCIQILWQKSAVEFLQFNFIAQMLIGVVLANLWLSVSRNRLQHFIALLPLVVALLLSLNMIISLLVLAFLPIKIELNELAVLLYFILHIVIMGIVAIPIWRKEKLDYGALSILFMLTASLPMWASFFVITN